LVLTYTMVRTVGTTRSKCANPATEEIETVMAHTPSKNY
jgi:hypothetical protein